MNKLALDTTSVDIVTLERDDEHIHSMFIKATYYCYEAATVSICIALARLEWDKTTTCCAIAANQSLGGSIQDNGYRRHGEG